MRYQPTSREPPLLWSRNTVGLVPILSHIGVSNIPKMAACNRKWLWNNVFLSYTSKQRNFNGYTYVFDVKQLDWTVLNTAVCRSEWEFKDGPCSRKRMYKNISPCIRDSNEILTVLPMFLASSIIIGLIQILFHVRVCGKFVVYIHFRLQTAIIDIIIDIPLTLT